MDRSLRGAGRTLLLLLCGATAALMFVPSPAEAGCGVLGLESCATSSTAAAPSPDPGGRESPDQQIPATGKAFGFNLGYKPNGDATADKSLAAMAALNVTHLRFGVSWQAIGGTSPGNPIGSELGSPIGSLPPSYSVAQWDRQYLDLVARGITPVIIAEGVPVWASTLYKCNDRAYAASRPNECPMNWWQGSHQPHAEFYTQFRQFVAAVARRYPRAVMEAHNEPDQVWVQNAPHRVDAKTAGAIQCQFHKAVRSVDSRRVLSMGMSYPDYERAFIARAKSCYDAFSFHPYAYTTSFGAGSVLADGFKGLRDARSAAGDTKPIWVTETGFSFVPGSDAAANRDKEALFADASRRLYNKLVTMPDVSAVLFHTLRDRYWASDWSGSIEFHYGFSYENWSPKPRMCTFVAMARNSWPGC